MNNTDKTISISTNNFVSRRLALGIRSSLLLTLCVAFIPLTSQAQDVSHPAILQVFEAEWETIENRMTDVFEVGYGRMWVPPPSRAGGGFSVGYDVFDRFDLGKPRDETRYGTSTGFKTMVQAAHDAGVLVNPDLIWNHNGVGNRNDSNFVNLGGYPGFALSLPNGPHNDIDGDYHNPFIDALGDDEILGQLAGLNDIAQEKDHQFIRHPTSPRNPNNIPAGTQFNKPDPNNARFYPDQALGGTTVFHPQLGTNVTLYDFNAANPLAGDPVSENALGLLSRNVRWMIQEYDVDGFRLDAARHFPRWVLDYFDQATFLAKRDPLLDGSPNHVYSFSETGGDSAGFIQDFIRDDIDNNNLGNIGGNRDVLDFRLFYAMRNNLTGNGLSNNWHTIRNASIDLNDDGLQNGSQGVAFVQSHDETGAYLSNVAHAYTLMLPGQALVYLNAEKDGPTGTFPQPGKSDALGGLYGETVTKLVDIRNSHGRGNFQERWLDDAFNSNGFSNIYIYERENSAIVGLNSRNDSFIETRNNVQTAFAPGSILVELTGNAADPTVDPNGNIPDSIKVNASGQIDVSIPSNDGHGRGYVIYGLAKPQGTLNLTNVTSTLAGSTPTGNTNGTARLADIQVIHTDSFDVQLNTTPVSLPDPDNAGQTVRDFHADGDQALLKFDEGLDLNSTAGVDHVTPGTASYGFEEFTTLRTPGYIDNGNGGNSGSGTGTYVQTIDATQLTEGRHYITTRTFRHRDSGPAIYEDIKQTIYVDRLPPEAAIASFEPFASNPNELDNRDLIIESVDQTASGMHVFLDLPADLSDAQVLAMALNGEGNTGKYDRDQWIAGYFDIKTGNHVATVVTFEPTYDGVHGFNVQRLAGLFTDTGLGAGFGDLDSDNIVEIADLIGIGNDSFEDVLYSQNAKFNAAADVDGDGDVDNLDLIALGDEITGASALALSVYDDLLFRRGDVNQDGKTDGDDVMHLHANFGGSDWLEDLNVDGTVNILDVETLITDLVGTSLADFDLSGLVTGNDFLSWQRGFGGNGTARFDQGDSDLDGNIGADDLAAWMTLYGQLNPSSVQANSGVVPEPTSMMISIIALALWSTRRRIC